MENKGKIRVTFEFPVEFLDKIQLPEHSTPNQAKALAVSMGLLKSIGTEREIILSSEDSYTEELLVYMGPTICVQAAHRIVTEDTELAQQAADKMQDVVRDTYQRYKIQQDNEGDY